ncbi:hypothetical protein NIES73_13770 [Sphaerospermopsis kisseleviana NIES-73]|nr:hypothetical protein NIES73_13770 [Sphaerospermopsis kisseleviana NIES-73]
MSFKSKNHYLKAIPRKDKNIISLAINFLIFSFLARLALKIVIVTVKKDQGRDSRERFWVNLIFVTIRYILSYNLVIITDFILYY